MTSKEGASEDQIVEEIDYSDIWDIKTFLQDEYWFLKTGNIYTHLFFKNVEV